MLNKCVKPYLNFFLHFQIKSVKSVFLESTFYVKKNLFAIQEKKKKICWLFWEKKNVRDNLRIFKLLAKLNFAKEKVLKIFEENYW